jgi:hypothetical protein
VLDGVTVIDVQQGRRIPSQRVVIVGNRIRSMGSERTVPVPKGARVVDARGKYLIPGLWDMHIHPLLYTDFYYPLLLANGVTGIRDAASQIPLDTLIMWRREILAGTRVGPPRQILSGPALDEGHSITDPYHLGVDSAADARRVVDSLKAAGADIIKTYALGREMYFVIAAEARRIGIPFGGHIQFYQNPTSAIEASDSGASIIDHQNTAGGLDTLCLIGAASVERCQPVAERFRRNGTWWVPTMIHSITTAYAHDTSIFTTGVFQKIEFRPILERFYQFSHEFWDGAVFHTNWLHNPAHIPNLAHAPQHDTLADTSRGIQGIQMGTPVMHHSTLSIAHHVGLPILAGTDGVTSILEWQPPGFDLHMELAIYVAKGLTPLEALQTATLNPAKLLHGTDSLGTVAPGKLADLVLLDADPLKDITNTTLIRAVIANGRYFDRAALDQLIATVQTKAKQEPRPVGRARDK